MNNDLNVNRLIHKMKETSIPEADIAGKVMHKVHAFHDNHRIPKQQRLRISPVWVAACALIFISTASVSAAAFFKTTWNGIQVNISDNDKGTSMPVDKSELSYKEKFEMALLNSADVWETISVEEAAKQFPFSLLRPQDSEFTLVKSFGVVLKDTNNRVKSADEWWLGGFYDIVQWNQSEIVVKQGLDVEMTETLKDPNKTMSMTFHEAPWENVEIADDTLAMFTANGNENLLVVNYKTADLNVVTLELSGDVTKEELVTVARAYVEK